MDSGIVLMDVDHSGHVNILQALHDRMVDEGTLTPEAEMLRLVKLRDSMQAEELMDAIAKSKYSVADVIKMVKGKKQNTAEE